MEGYLFHWISWCIWIYAMFIMNRKHPFRYPLAYGVLIAILLSTINVTIFNMNIVIAIFPLWLFACFLLAKFRGKTLIYLCICAIIMSFSGATFFIMALFDPFWVVIDLIWLEGIFATILTTLLVSGLWERISIFLIGFIHAEFIYGFILNSLQIDYNVGNFLFLDGLVVSALCISLWTGFETAFINFQKNNQMEKEKQL